MTKESPEALIERGTLVRCMGAGGVVVASTRSISENDEIMSKREIVAPALNI